MGVFFIRAVSLLAFLPAAFGFPFGENTHASTSLNSLFGRQSDEGEWDPEDLSFITRMAAIGDSYSAGIGAGKRLGSIVGLFDPTSDYACSRYDHAYPYLINTDGRLGDASRRKFQFKSCSGAVTKDIWERQIPDIDSNQQVIMLSAGGNDAQLTNILNQCVYQWASLTPLRAQAAKLIAEVEAAFTWAETFDWDAIGRGCEGQLDYSEALINSAEFGFNLDAVVAAAKQKLGPGGMIYWTGYAKFWGEDMDRGCDRTSWSTFLHTLENSFQPKAFLTRNHRERMNRLVDAVNAKIAASVKQAGPQVEFVDYDRYVGMTAGRFCEVGVDESASNSGERPGLMFYEMNAKDPFGGNPWKRSEDPVPENTFESHQNIMAQITLLADKDSIISGGDQNLRIAPDDDEISSIMAFEIPRILPDGYARVFHPQPLLHRVIANLIIYHMGNTNSRVNGWQTSTELVTVDTSTCPYTPNQEGRSVLRYRGSSPGRAVKPGTDLRILCAGDSITVGFLSEQNGGDGNGYRLKLRENLSKDNVEFAGTVSGGRMSDGYYAAWSGKTIKYITDHIGPSLEQKPNIILLHAGTNDMNPNGAISTEGNDPQGAARRLGDLIDQMVKASPGATILVAMIVNTCDQNQSPRTKEYQKLIPGVVQQRRNAGQHVLAVDLTDFPMESLQDCIHPTNDGYHLFGDYWYDFILQIPRGWIQDPEGDGPNRNGIHKNGGVDGNIPPPDWGVNPVRPGTKSDVARSFELAARGDKATCKVTPHWYETGAIALGGVGRNGGWQYTKNWVQAGEVASGLKRDPKYVRLQDMNGDGRADYVWLDPESRMIICWINNLPKPWAPAGNNGGVIGSGAGPADSIFLADMNGDGLDDYMVVNPDNGAVKIWWNYGPDANWVNGWKFVEGGEIATGVPHANWATLRFPDINGDGRADYVYIGEGGSLKHYMNTGSHGGQDPLFIAMGGIATGATSDITRLVFADMDGDGRDDYLIWDDVGGLTGYLNQQTNREGVPLYISQGPPKTIADGITQSPDSIRLADLDGDGKDDYVWLDPATGAPTVFTNEGQNNADSLGWLWSPLNGGNPIASGAATAARVKFGDIDGDGKDDYLVLDSKTGALDAYLNKGSNPGFVNGWRWEPIGQIATGLGPGANVRFADIDGDGKDEYIYLHAGGRTTIFRNVFHPDTPLTQWRAMPDADASGIGQRPEDIDFVDINGDGKADYVWTRPVDGRVMVWFNNYPNLPTWLAQGEIAGGVGTSGANVRWADLQGTGRASYVAVDPKTGGIAAWLNGCDDLAPNNPSNPSKPPPPRDAPCTSVDNCRQYACEDGRDAQCSVSGGPFTGNCVCSSDLSRVAGFGPGGNSTSFGLGRNSSSLLGGSARSNSTTTFTRGSLANSNVTLEGVERNSADVADPLRGVSKVSRLESDS